MQSALSAWRSLPWESPWHDLNAFAGFTGPVSQPGLSTIPEDALCINTTVSGIRRRDGRNGQPDGLLFESTLPIQSFAYWSIWRTWSLEFERFYSLPAQAYTGFPSF